MIINLSPLLKRLEEKQHIEMFSGRPILYDNNGCSKHYSFKKSFSSSYLANVMGSAMKLKAISNQIKQ